MSHTHDNLVPPAALKAAALLILLSIALVLAVRVGLVPASGSAAEMRRAAAVAPETERLLRFEDSTDGMVRVIDAATGRQTAAIGREGGGFIRGVLRGLARERRMHGIGQAPPFRLTLWTDNALSLTDPQTGRVIELNSFGPDNRTAFLRLLEKDT